MQTPLIYHQKKYIVLLPERYLPIQLMQFAIVTIYWVLYKIVNGDSESGPWKNYGLYSTTNLHQERYNIKGNLLKGLQMYDNYLCIYV